MRNSSHSSRFRKLRDTPAGGGGHQGHEWVSDLEQKTQGATQETQEQQRHLIFVQQRRQAILISPWSHKESYKGHEE